MAGAPSAAPEGQARLGMGRTVIVGLSWPLGGVRGSARQVAENARIPELPAPQRKGTRSGKDIPLSRPEGRGGAGDKSPEPHAASPSYGRPEEGGKAVPETYRRRPDRGVGGRRVTPTPPTTRHKY